MGPAVYEFTRRLSAADRINRLSARWLATLGMFEQRRLAFEGPIKASVGATQFVNQDSTRHDLL
jgi:hypothetical protein